MSRRRYERAAEIFADVIGVEGAERAAAVERACAGDDALRRAVDRLLDSDSGDSFLDVPYGGAEWSDTPEMDYEHVVRIGEYAIRRLIDRGGMGAVYLAEQANPKRDVAIKLFAIDTRAGATLSNEAAALGRLQHPGIARIYEAGVATVTTRSGPSTTSPFVAMEYIEGQTLGALLGERALSREQIVTMLLGITEAIEHAHQRGVIHRDLKPSNIVVTNDLAPHVIDFGVGLIRDDDESASERSEPNAGTIAYMAPEQLLGRFDQIDTRVDLYAIGAIAYEMITGKKLHESSGSVDGALLSRLASGPLIDRKSLAHVAGYELATVICRAVEPDLAKRYSSAGALAADLRRVIEGRPIGGDEASPWRTMLLYGRRHRGVAGVVAAATVLVVSALIGMMVATARSSLAAKVADDALATAQAEAEHAAELADFLKASFLGVDPEERGASVSLFDAIDYAAGRVDRDLADTPAAEADVRFAIGFVYRRHGRLEPALEHIHASHRIRNALYGPEDERTLESAEELGFLAWLYEGDTAGALERLGSALSSHEAAGRERSASAAWINIKMASILLSMDEPAQAERRLLVAEPIMVEVYGSVFAARTTRQRSLAALYQGDTAEAVQLARRALVLCEGVPEQEYIVARSYMTLGEVLRANGDTDEAEAALRTAARAFGELLAYRSLESAAIESELAWLMLERGEVEAAMEHALAGSRARAAIQSPEHPELRSAEALVSLCMAAKEHGEERRRLLDNAMRLVSAAYGPDHREAIRVLHHTQRLDGLAAEDLAGADSEIRRLMSSRETRIAQTR